MRPIKFRAWDKTMNVMEPVCELSFADDGQLLGVRLGNSESSVGFYNFSDATVELMQFTGLKDKNGKEIYEGDLVKGDNGRAFEVRNNGLSFYAFYLTERTALDLVKEETYYEVIGNIWEHLDLLK
jgi:uncharacterized phage protein (TIGR01671 family)